MESVHTYNYRIRVAGDLDNNKLDLLHHNLQKFSPVKISTPKSTPIQKTVAGFPGLENERVITIDAEFRYPATEPMVRQLAQLLGIDENLVRMVSTDYADSLQSEAEGYANESDHSPVLTREEMEEQPGAKEAAKAYGNSYLDSIKEQTKDDKMDIPYSGTKTPNAFDPFKPETQMASMGKDSPMSKISRPAKPQTGAHKG
jgi:Rod binding domain-containing protein